MLAAAASGAAPAWDCLPAPDGRDWSCTEAAGSGPVGPPAAAPASGTGTAATRSGETSPTRNTGPSPAPLPVPGGSPRVPDAPAPPPGTAADTKAGGASTAPRAADTGTATGVADGAGAAQAAKTGDTGQAVAAPAAAGAAATTGGPDRIEASETPALPPAAESGGTTGDNAESLDARAPPDPAAIALAAAAIDEGIDWDNCPTAPGSDARGFRAQPFEPGEAPVFVEADSIESAAGGERTLLLGNVEVTQGELQIRTDRMLLDRSTGEADARGSFLMIRPDMRVAGEAARYQLRAGTGQIDRASYRIPSMRARGDADEAAFLGEGRSRYRNITLSTCRPGEDDWLLEADVLELDHAEGLGTATDATLSFMKVPFLYAPTITFPIDDRRRSGFLIPSAGYGSKTGFDLTVPYYFNLAENYDLTFSPRLMSKRGLLLNGEARLLTRDTSTEFDADLLPNDRAYEGEDSLRAAVSLIHTNRFGPRTRGDVRFAWVSDNDYLDDLGESLAVTSATHLEQLGQVRHVGDTWTLTGRVQKFQTIDEDIANRNRPYARLPQLLFRLRDPRGIGGTTYHMDAEFVHFDRRDSVTGQRVDLLPAISLPLRRTWGFLVPKAGARYTAYSLNDEAAGADDAPSTASALLSLDSGLFFDRSAGYFGRPATHTLEPRIFYLYVPRRAQDDQPIFDTAEVDLNFDNLFRENRFTGADRFGDANQATLALTSRFLDEASGAELLRARIGQILYFEDRDVTLPGRPVGDDDTSPVVAELSGLLGTGWRATAAVEWDPHADGDQQLRQGLALLSYRGAEKRAVNIGYRLRDEGRDATDIEQTDVAAAWPIGPRFSLVGRHNYSLRENRLLEAIAGLEYRSCCWQVRTLLRGYTDDDSRDLKIDFLVQLELNGLGRFGDEIEELLQRSVYGYN